MPSLLPLEDYKRYGRQMILDEIGLEGLFISASSRQSVELAAGQCKLKSAAVAIIGAGGLGCPAAQYLAAAGIGMGCMIYEPIYAGISRYKQVAYWLLTPTPSSYPISSGKYFTRRHDWAHSRQPQPWSHFNSEYTANGPPALINVE
jgi:hypothetical protein